MLERGSVGGTGVLIEPGLFACRPVSYASSSDVSSALLVTGRARNRALRRGTRRRHVGKLCFCVRRAASAGEGAARAPHRRRTRRRAQVSRRPRSPGSTSTPRPRRGSRHPEAGRGQREPEPLGVGLPGAPAVGHGRQDCGSNRVRVVRGLGQGEDIGEALFGERAEQGMARELGLRRGGAREAAEEARALAGRSERGWMLGRQLVEDGSVEFDSGVAAGSGRLWADPVRQYEQWPHGSARVSPK